MATYAGRTYEGEAQSQPKGVAKKRRLQQQRSLAGRIAWLLDLAQAKHTHHTGIGLRNVWEMMQQIQVELQHQKQQLAALTVEMKATGEQTAGTEEPHRRGRVRSVEPAPDIPAAWKHLDEADTQTADAAPDSAAALPAPGTEQQENNSNRRGNGSKMQHAEMDEEDGNAEAEKAESSEAEGKERDSDENEEDEEMDDEGSKGEEVAQAGIEHVLDRLNEATQSLRTERDAKADLAKSLREIYGDEEGVTMKKESLALQALNWGVELLEYMRKQTLLKQASLLGQSESESSLASISG